MRRESGIHRSGALPLILAFALLSWHRVAMAQTEFVRGNFFPAEMEFRELGAVKSDRALDNLTSPHGITGGTILVEAGCQRYAVREYEVVGGGLLSIEVATLKDPKASYSVLTLLRSSPVEEGPPGQFHAYAPGEILFAQGNMWARIKSTDADLGKRVAVSVSNRIGTRESSLPGIVKRVPPEGLEAGSLRYFLGPESYRIYGEPPSTFQLLPTRDLEIVQARYQEAGRSGTLSLVGFPTNQVAQEYFDGLSVPAARTGSKTTVRTYAKRAGPLVAILEGTFEPEQADKILGSLEFQYSIRWIYDKNNRSSATVWGVPVGLLGTVVRSLVLVALLCLASIFLGLGIAIFRVMLRTYAPGNLLDRPERTEVIRLKLDEN